MTDNEEAIKRRILQQRMQEQMQAQVQLAEQQQQMQEMEAALKVITSRILEPKARDRLSNLKYVKPELAMQLELYLAQLYQSGQLRTKITEEQLIIILRKLTEKKETKIRRK